MNRKKIPSIVLVCAVLLGLAAAYGNFCRQAKYLKYEVFDLNRTVSWEKKDGNIFRTASKGNFDMFLLAKDDFQGISLKLNIVNPRDCGIIFNYAGQDNYYTLYFDTAHQAVLWLKTTPDGTSVIERGILPLVAVLPVELDIRENGAKFSVKGQTHSRVTFNDGTKGSRLFGGLMIKDADAPKVIFNDVQIEGTTAEGVNVRVSGDEFHVPQGRYVFALLFLCAMMAVSASLLARVISLRQDGDLVSKEFKLTGVQAGVIHAAGAVLLFLPFIFRQEILVSSADNFGQIFPLFFFSKQNFLQILSGGEPILWNPYAHNGVPFFSNHWNMTYYPLNWPVFLLQDSAVMSALTLRTMIEVFLIGFLGYRLFLAEIGSAKWAMVSSLAYQLGSFLIFSMTLFPVTSLFFAMTLYLYVLWTLPQRRDWLNAVLLAGSIILILTGGNMAFVFYGGLTVAVATLYRFKSSEVTRKRSIVLLGSLVSAFLMSAVRIIPCLFGVSESNRIVEHFYTLHDRATMFVRLFVPEIVGWLGPNFLNALTSPNWNFIYEQADLPSNSQNTFFAYFGIIPALLILSSIFIPAKGKLKFWKIYCWTAIALGLMIQPLWGVFNILTFPFNHYSYYIIILPLGVCMLAGLAGKYWEEETADWQMSRERIGSLVLAVQILIAVMVTYLFPQNALWAKWLILILAGWWIGFKVSGRFRDKYFSVSRITFLCVLWVWFFIAASVLMITPVFHKESIIPGAVLPVIGLFLVAALGVEVLRKSHKRFVVLFGGVVFALVLVLTPWIKSLLNLDAGVRNYFLDMSFAEIKFAALSFLFFSAWGLFRKGRISPRTCGALLIFVLFLDLLAFNCRFDNVVAPSPLGQAFYNRGNPYSSYEPRIHQIFDLKNFRMNNLHQAGWRDNENLIAEIPSYSGIVGHMPKRFSNFIVNFGYPARTVLIYPSESTDNARFLDLCAVKYTGWSQQVRETTLSRMMLYSNFAVVPDDQEILAMLKSADFVPRDKILLGRQPEGVESFAGSKGIPIAITSAAANKVTADVSAAQPGVILFVESFDNGWRAYVDGMRADIIPANYAFMAISVEKGEHSIVFRYEPPLYTFSLGLSVLGIIVFGLFKFYLFRNKQ